MAPANMHEWAVNAIWQLLQDTPEKLLNPKYHKVFPSLDAVQTLMTQAGVQFAPDLLATVQSSTPPKVSFFEGLPSMASGGTDYGDYELVLKKLGYPDIVYNGSATAKKQGMAKRSGNYEKKENLPKHVEEALDQGYRITSKGLFCWAPRPKTGMMFRTRALFKALEAVFSLVFWTLKLRDTDYGMPDLCPWLIDDIDYEGACSHVCSTEGIQGEEDDLSPAERVQWHLDADARRKAMQKISDARQDPEKRRRRAQRTAAKALALKRFKCHPCNQIFPAAGKQREHDLTTKHKDKVNGVTRKPAKDPYDTAWRAKNIASKKYFCRPCDKAFDSQSKLDRHLGGATCKRKTPGYIDVEPAQAPLARAASKDGGRAARRRAQNIAAKRYFCRPCDKVCDEQTKLDRHKKTDICKQKTAAYKDVRKVEGPVAALFGIDWLAGRKYFRASLV